jgi:hypothetical protein
MKNLCGSVVLGRPWRTSEHNSTLIPRPGYAAPGELLQRVDDGRPGWRGCVGYREMVAVDLEQLRVLAVTTAAPLAGARRRDRVPPLVPFRFLFGGVGVTRPAPARLAAGPPAPGSHRQTFKSPKRAQKRRGKVLPGMTGSGAARGRPTSRPAWESRVRCCGALRDHPPGYAPGGSEWYLSARRAAARGQAAGALRAALCAEAVTRRQPQARAGQVVRADRTAPYAPPARQLTRPVRRELRPVAARRGISKPVRGGLRGHDVPSCAISGIGPGPVAGQRDLRLMPFRNSASTSARRYRGLPVSLRTSGSCPRRAHDATDAEVTRNRTATCLRVIRSSSMRLPVIATAANPRAAGWHKYSPAELVSASLCSSGSLVDRNRVIRGWRRSPCTVPEKARAAAPKCCCRLH